MNPSLETIENTTPFLEGSNPPRPQGQLPLPTGPTHVLKGRPRTNLDDVWLDAMRRQALHHLDPTKPSASDRTDEDVLRAVSWAASCNDERACWASMGGLQVKLRGMSRSTVQRSLSRWSARGVFEFQHRKGGRPSQSSRGRFNVLVLKLKNDHVNPVKMTDRSKKNLDLDLPIPVSPFGKVLKPDCKGVKASEKQPAPIESTKAKAKDGGRVNRMWYGLQRNLGGWSESFLQEQGQGFARLNHAQKTTVINKLLEEERQAIAAGYLQRRQAVG